MEAEHLLMQKIYENTGMQELVDLAEAIIGNPIGFYLLNFTELACSNNYPKEAADDLINCRKKSTPSELTEWTERFMNSIVQCKPVAQSWPYMRYRYLVCGSIVGGSLIGYITLPQLDNPLEEIDYNLVELVAKIYGIALSIKEESHIRSSEHSLLWGLLTERINPEYLHKNILYPAFGNAKTYRMLWFLSHDADGAPLTDTDIHELLQCFKYRWNILFEEGYVVLIDGDEHPWEELAAIAKIKGVFIGVSDIFSDLEDTKRNCTNAQYALRYATYLKKPSKIAWFDDYKLFHMISKVKEKHDPNKYTPNRIKEIELHDLKNNTEYLATLRTYFQCNRKISDMAKQLYVHKNTVVYRVKRLQELFDINFDDCYQIASLACSMLIHDKVI